MKNQGLDFLVVLKKLTTHQKETPSKPEPGPPVVLKWEKQIQGQRK
jgi:hypothetical protein